MRLVLLSSLILLFSNCYSQQTITDTIIHDGLNRTYILYVPASYSPSNTVPLVINFHGYTSNSSEQMFYGDFRSIADTANFILVHPMGTLDGSSQPYWNANWGGTVDDIGFTEALIEFNLALERDSTNQTVNDAMQTTRRRLNEELGNLIQKGRQEFQNENYSVALRLFSEARLLSPDDPDVLKEIETLVERTKIQENIQRGLLLYDIGQYNNALQIFGQVLESDPNNEFIKQYYDRTKLETTGKSEEMDATTKRKYLEGVDKFLLGRYQEAISIWEEILKTNPDNKKVLEALNGAKERLKRSQSN